MRILLIIDHLGRGGAQRQMVSLAEGIANRGHQVELFLYHPSIQHLRSILEKSGVRVHIYNKTRRFSLLPSVQIARLLKSNSYDAMIAFLNTPSFYAEIAALAAKNTVPLIVSQRSSFTTSHIPASAKLRFLLHRTADHITVNSHHHREHLIQLFPWLINRTTTIYNGVDLSLFYPRDKTIRNSVPETQFLVLSNVREMKNAYGLAQALVRLAKQNRSNLPAIHWAGRFLDTDFAKKEVARTDALLERAGIAHHWTWLGPRDDVPSLIRKYDALIHPSFYEGLPNAICEALASGLPILASDTGDHPILVGGDERGFLFDPLDISAIAETLLQFMRLPAAQRSQMGIKSRQFAERNLSQDRYVTEYIRLVNQLKAARI